MKLLEDIPRDGLLTGREFGRESVDPVVQGGDFHVGDLGYGQRVDLEIFRLFFQAGAVTNRAFYLLVDIVGNAFESFHLGKCSVSDPEKFVRTEHQQ